MIIRDVIDVSNYTAPFTDRQLQDLDAWRPIAVVGCQFLEPARVQCEQLGARGIGLTLNLYAFPEDPERQVNNALGLIDYDPEHAIWLDAELASQSLQDMRDARAMVESKGLKAGVYSAAWYWERYLAGVTEFSDMPLWQAHYSPPNWADFVAFGGWTEPMMIQYSSNGIFGINCDLSLLKDTWSVRAA